MKGLEISEVRLTEIKKNKISNRIDSEHFLKIYQKNIDEIKSYKNGYSLLNKFLKKLSGGATPLGADYSDSGIMFLRVQNIMQNYFDLNDVVFISDEQDEEIKRSRLKENDVLLTITGVSYGKSAVVDERLKGSNINQHSVKMELSNELNPYFLSTFLNSKYGKLQSDKYVVGVTRPALDYESIRNFLIPNVPNDIQLDVEEVVLKSAKLDELSKQLYSEAESLLLSELGLKDWQPKNDNVSIKSFSDFNKTGRLDAEYYQNKYDELYEVVSINAKSMKNVSEIQTYNARGLQPEYVEGGKLAVINSKHILETGLDYDNFESTDISFWNNERSRVFKNDILVYTTGANIGRTAVYLKDEKAIASNHVNILRINVPNSIYVGFVMNSLIGRMQTEKLSAGSAQQELYPKDIENFFIPFVDVEIQRQISSKIQESFALQSDSKRLLEEAKMLVEREIEE